MSEQSNVWGAKMGGTHMFCPKIGMKISGCTLGIDCKECIRGEEISPKLIVKRRK